MVSSEYAAAKQAGNGVTLAFGFSFKILASSDLVVYKIDASGNQSAALALGTDYTVSFDPIAETGTVTYATAPVNGGFSLITRVSNDQQQTRLPREGPMPASTVETMIDKVVLRLQELEAAAVSLANFPASSSGLFSARPSAPTILTVYYSTDRGSIDLWVPAAARWFTIG